MSEPERSNFGSRLRQLREAAGLTQEALAQAAGMHKFGIAKLERGEREPSWATVRTLAKVLGVNCLAFDIEEPLAESELPRPRGRPKKADANQADSQKPGATTEKKRTLKRKEK